MTMTLSGTSGVTFPNSSTSTVGGLGDGQTWQDVTASRASGTTYTNSTGKPIMVVWKATSGNNPTVVVNGVTIYSGVAYMVNVEFIVPNGQTYSITAANFTWCELR